MRRKPSLDPYAVLGVTHNASLEEIKEAYRYLALATHPDRNAGDSSAEFSPFEDGREMLKLKLGRNPDGHVYHLAGKGMRESSDVLVKVFHLLPKNIDEAQAKCLGEILEKYHADVTSPGS